MQYAKAVHWRASSYRLRTWVVDPGDAFKGEEPLSATFVEAAPRATWHRYDPFSPSYKPSSSVEDAQAGPHVEFLTLGNKMMDREVPVNTVATAVSLFAERHGLLGLFSRQYVEHIVLPEARYYVAPEAAIDRRGKLGHFSPKTVGMALPRAATPNCWLALVGAVP